MSDPFVVSRIQHLPLCQALTPEEVDLLSDAFQIWRLAPDTIVFQQGQPSQGIYVFVYGSGVLLQTNASGSARPVAMVTAGQYINEGALFAEMQQTATLRIVEPAVVLFLSRESLRALVARYPQLGANINEYLRERNRADVPLVKPPPPPPPNPAYVPPPAQSNVPLVQPAPPHPAPTPVTSAPPQYPQPGTSAPLVQPMHPIQPSPIAQQPRPAVPPSPVPQTNLPATPIAPPTVGQPVPVTPVGQGMQPGVPAVPIAAPAVPAAQPILPSPAVVEPLTPQPMLFAGQRENEIVVTQRWRHWWAFARFAWAPILMLIGLVILSFVVPVPVVQLASSILAVFLPGVALLYLFREWRNDRLIVTSERVVWIEQKLIPFVNNVLEVPIEGVLEVVAEYPPYDPFARFLNYGTLRLRTSGSAGNITLDMMPDPLALQRLLFTSRDQYRQVAERQQRNVIRAEVNQLIEGKDPKKAVTHVPPTILGGLNPLATRFMTAKGEVVYRKHWLVWLQNIILPFLVVLIGFVLALWSLTREGDARLFMLAASAFPLVIGGLWLYWADWDWRNDKYIVGDERITLIHQRPLWLQNRVDTLNLAQVDSVATDQQGFINALLNRGDVRLSLEGMDNVKRFDSVYDPRGVAAEISTRQARIRQQQQASQVRQQQQAVADYLSVYHETVSQNPAVGQPYRPPAGQQPPPTQRTTDAERPPKFPRKQ